MELEAALQSALERLLTAGRVEVRENGAWLAELEDFRFEVRSHPTGVLLHLWSTHTNTVRRVVGVTADEDGVLEVEVIRFGRARPERLRFSSAEAQQAGRISREQFRARLRELLAQQFPDETIATLSTAADLEHSLSGNYTRGAAEAGSQSWALLAAAPGESAATYDGLLAFGLLWLERMRESQRRKIVGGLRLLFPAGAGKITAHRAKALSPEAAVQLYEYDLDRGRARLVEPAEAGNVVTWLTPRREIEATLRRAEPEVERVRRLCPEAIRAEVIPGTQEVALRFRGLAFATLRREGLFFGLDDRQVLLTPSREADLLQLVDLLQIHRSPLASDHRHTLYRARPERWLEWQVAADPSRVHARISAHMLYSQVPAFSAGDRGVMDLTGVTRDGRLALLELKASEDLQLVLQAVDYWLRVRWHQSQGDFERYGYFSGLQLDARPPLLFLVAPALRFHPACDVLLRYIRRDIEICRVGLAENWRRGLRVVLRQEREGLVGRAAAGSSS